MDQQTARLSTLRTRVSVLRYKPLQFFAGRYSSPMFYLLTERVPRKSRDFCGLAVCSEKCENSEKLALDDAGAGVPSRATWIPSFVSKG